MKQLMQGTQRTATRAEQARGPVKGTERIKAMTGGVKQEEHHRAAADCHHGEKEGGLAQSGGRSVLRRNASATCIRYLTLAAHLFGWHAGKDAGVPWCLVKSALHFRLGQNHHR